MVTLPFPRSKSPMQTLTRSLSIFLIGAFAASVHGQPSGEKYAAAVAELRTWIAKEVAAKKIPALSLAVVDDQAVIWAEGFGHVDTGRMTAAGPRTPYRIGSVSKPITALLLMLYVEQGLIDLDAPITDYLPSFRPVNKTSKRITPRQLVSHRAGIVREPPVGGYFDAGAPSLAATVASLNDTQLVYEPEAKTSYSNAGPCVVGMALEQLEKKPFAVVMKQKLLDPLGMSETTVEISDEQRKRMPRALMWTYHGHEFPAPVFDLATTPAGNVTSTALDQAKLLSFLLSGGRGPKGPLLKRETLEKMWAIQFAKEGDKAGFGLGFFVSEFDGIKRIGHGGAVYGYATEFAALPREKLGVVVFAARDVANGLTRHVADTVLRHVRAARNGKPLPSLDVTAPVGRDLARSLEGRYRKGGEVAELVEREGRLWFWPPRTGLRVEVRKRGSELIVDDVLAFGAVLAFDKNRLTWNKESFERETPPEPRSIPATWEGLIGEYGPDHNHLVILEKDGQLHALIEWVFLYPLRHVKDDVYQFPDYGMYHGHPLTFHRDASGRAKAVEAANFRFARRPLPRPGETFTLKPRRPVAELRKVALAADPPLERNALFRKPDLVDVTKLDAGIKLDIRYAGDNNFLGTPFYTSSRAFLQRPAAEAVVRIHRRFKKFGFGLLIHDAYRPWFVSKMFFDAVEPRFHDFVADPMKGSRHNRGCAVDLTLYDRATGKAIDMVGGYDEFTDRSYPDYVGGTSLQRFRRDQLRRAMEAENFTVFDTEWWHFDFAAWRSYPLLNVEFEKLP